MAKVKEFLKHGKAAKRQPSQGGARAAQAAARGAAASATPTPPARGATAPVPLTRETMITGRKVVSKMGGMGVGGLGGRARGT